MELFSAEFTLIPGEENLLIHVDVRVVTTP